MIPDEGISMYMKVKTLLRTGFTLTKHIGRRVCFPVSGVHRCGLALAVLLSAFAGFAADAAPVPGKATGIWAASDCNGPGEMYFVNSAAVIVFSGSRVAVVPVSWAGGVLIFKLAKRKKLLPLDDLTRCRALPPLFRTLYPETVVLFRAFDRVRPHCEKTTSVTCVAAIFKELDVVGDGRLSQAELGRLLRAMGFFVGYALKVSGGKDIKRKFDKLGKARLNYLLQEGKVFVPMQDLIAVPALTALLGSFLTDSLIRSYDFDGDGFLSIKELMQDHASPHMTAVAGALGTAGTDLAVKTMLGFIPSLLRWLPLGR